MKKKEEILEGNYIVTYVINNIRHSKVIEAKGLKEALEKLRKNKLVQHYFKERARCQSTNQ